jgi:SAM-dependent methyltransferase
MVSPTSERGCPMTGNWRDVNLANWNERVPAHVASQDYGFERFASDPDHLSHVVQFDRPRLGDIRGLRGVHLQCHIGTDTVSLARLGAHMSGLDFSEPAIVAARHLAEIAGQSVEFYQADLYDAVDVLGRGTFDFVFTGIGALCWLPDIARWGQLVADLLAPGGRLFVRDGHPMLWALDERHPDVIVVEYPYFEQPDPLVWDEDGTYVDTEASFVNTTTHSWNHGIGEIVSSLLNAGLSLTMLVEHDSVPWDALPGKMVVDDAGEWRLSDRPERLAASYTLQAVKPIAPTG